MQVMNLIPVLSILSKTTYCLFRPYSLAAVLLSYLRPGIAYFFGHYGHVRSQGGRPKTMYYVYTSWYVPP